MGIQQTCLLAVPTRTARSQAVGRSKSGRSQIIAATVAAEKNRRT